MQQQKSSISYRDSQSHGQGSSCRSAIDKNLAIENVGVEALRKPTADRWSTHCRIKKLLMFRQQMREHDEKHPNTACLTISNSTSQSLGGSRPRYIIIPL